MFQESETFFEIIAAHEPEGPEVVGSASFVRYRRHCSVLDLG
jgi:hypothetical protein